MKVFNKKKYKDIYMKHTKTIIILIILAILIYPISFLLLKNKNSTLSEKFTNMHQWLRPAQYPQSDDGNLLKGFYDWNKPFPPNPNKTMSGLNYARQATAFPIYPAKSCSQNNIEFWPTPINGTCAFPELCGNWYKPLNCEKQKERFNPMIIKGKPIRIWPYCKKNGQPTSRVNFYCSTE